MAVVHSYKPQWPDELELLAGDVILVLSKHEEERWFGRLQGGQRGYFPASCVMELSQVGSVTEWAQQCSIFRSAAAGPQSADCTALLGFRPCYIDALYSISLISNYWVCNCARRSHHLRISVQWFWWPHNGWFLFSGEPSSKGPPQEFFSEKPSLRRWFRCAPSKQEVSVKEMPNKCNPPIHTRTHCIVTPSSCSIPPLLKAIRPAAPLNRWPPLVPY